MNAPNGEKKPYDVDFPKFHPAYLIASWFWSGRLRPAAGTWGTLAAMPLWWALYTYTSMDIMIAVIIILFIIGGFAVEYIEKKCGKENSHDASVFVIDEVVGVGVTLLALYSLENFGDLEVFLVPLCLVLGFIFFRVFDIIKPAPAYAADTKLHNGWGVMLDDVIAGFYGLITLTGAIASFTVALPICFYGLKCSNQWQWAGVSILVFTPILLCIGGVCWLGLWLRKRKKKKSF